MAATAIIAPFEAVEPIVYRWRRAHTTDGALGMPAHVTLAYPFLDDTDLEPEQLGDLGAVLAHFRPFDVSFAAVARFDGPPPVLYLEPNRQDQFRAMIAAIVERFPEYPPFGGVFEEIVPHLTVAQTADEAVLAGAEAAIAPHLPITTPVTGIELMQHHGASGWRVRSTFSL